MIFANKNIKYLSFLFWFKYLHLSILICYFETMKIILLICLVFVACKATPNNDIVKYKVHCLKTNSLKEIELRGKNICLSPFNKGETITVNDSGFVCSDTTKNKYVVIYQVK